VQRASESDLSVEPERAFYSNLARFAWCKSNLFHVPPLENPPPLDAGLPRESLLRLLHNPRRRGLAVDLPAVRQCLRCAHHYSCVVAIPTGKPPRASVRRTRTRIFVRSLSGSKNNESPKQGLPSGPLTGFCRQAEAWRGTKLSGWRCTSSLRNRNASR